MILLVGTSPVRPDKTIAPLAGLWAAHPAGATLLDPCGSVSWLTAHPNLPVVYGIGRAAGGRDGDAATGVSAIGSPVLRAWRVIGSPTGPEVRPLGEVALSGDGPCHVVVDGPAAFVAYYTSGQIGRVSLNSDGSPSAVTELTVQLAGQGPDADRQESSHPHQVLVGRDGDIVVTDLGADAVIRLDAITLSERSRSSLRAGAGPRHSALLADGRLVVAGELDESVTILANGRPTGHAASTGIRPAIRNYPSDIRPLPQNRVVVANRGAHSLAVFDVGGETPELVAEWPAGGAWPQALATESGDEGDLIVVADRDDDIVVAHRLSDSAAIEWTVRLERPTALVAVDSLLEPDDLPPINESEEHP